MKPIINAGVIAISLLLSPCLLAVEETEPNDAIKQAQDLDGLLSLDQNDDIGDKSNNTSQFTPHLTVLGSGTGPANKDIFKFSVNEAGKGIFDIDYGDIGFRPDRFGIATQLDGTIWIKDKQTFYFLDEQNHPQWGFNASYGTAKLHNTLAVQPITGQFFSVNRETDFLVSIDPGTGVATDLGSIGISQISAIAFNQAGDLFAITGANGAASILYQLDPSNGSVIQTIGDTEYREIKGIDFDPVSGTLYGSARQNFHDLNNTLAVDSSGDLYSIDLADNGYNDEAVLYRLDIMTGESHLVGSTGLIDIAAIAFHSDGRLFATSGSSGSPSVLYELDPGDGSVMQTVGDTEYFGITGLAFDPDDVDTLFAFSGGPPSLSLNSLLAADSSGTVYGIQNLNTSPYLVSIDTNSPYYIEYIAPLDLAGYITGLAFDENDDLFALLEKVDNENRGGCCNQPPPLTVLIKINPSDGSLIQEIGPTGFDSVQGLAFDPVSLVPYSHANALYFENLRNTLASDPIGVFYSIDENNGDLYTLDTATGIPTLVGNSGLLSVSALAFDGADLYAITGTGQTASTLYRLDPSNGSVISMLGSTGINGIVGLDFHPASGDLYAHRNDANLYTKNSLAIDSTGLAFTIDDRNAQKLVSFDPADGKVNLIGETGLSDEIVSLAFDDTNQLFATTGSGGQPSTLYELNPMTGAVMSTIGPIGFNGVTGLTFHPDTGELYGHAQDPNTLIIINKDTGVGASPVPSGISGNLPDMAFDPAPPYTLYGFNRDDNDVYSIDLGTGAATRLGDFGGSNRRVGMAMFDDVLYLKAGETFYTVNTGNGLGSEQFELSQTGTLFTLDKTNGNVLTQLTTETLGNLSDISFDPVSEELYAWSGEDVRTVVTINIGDGSITPLPDPGSIGNAVGLAFSMSSNELFLKDNNSVWSIDTGTGIGTKLSIVLQRAPQLLSLDKSTGAATPVGQSISPLLDNNQGRFTDLAFDRNMANGTYGKLYGHHTGDYDVYTFDLGDGQATPLGGSVSNSGGGGLTHDGTKLWLNRNIIFYNVNQATGSGSITFFAGHEETDDDTLLTLDITNAMSTVVGQTGVNKLADLTFDDKGTLYAMRGRGQGSGLYTLDTVSAVASSVGNPDVNDGSYGLAYDFTSNTLYLKERNRIHEVNKFNASSNFLIEIQGKPGGLLTIDSGTAAVGFIGESFGMYSDIPDVSFSQDGKLFGFERDNDTLLNFDLATGKATTIWGFRPYGPGIDFAPDGTLWALDEDGGLYTIDSATGQASFETNTGGGEGSGVLAINSSGDFFTKSYSGNDTFTLFQLDPVTGARTNIGELDLFISALAFNGGDQLFGIGSVLNRGFGGDQSTLYEISTDDASYDEIGITGYNGIEAISFHPTSDELYAHTPQDGSLLQINELNGSTVVLDPTGVDRMSDFSFAPDERLFGWASRSFNGSLDESDRGFGGSIGQSLNSLVSVDVVSGAVTPIGRYGDFSSKLTLFDTDGVSILGSATVSPFSWGQLGSNPTIQTDGAANGEDSYIDFEFTLPGIYYLQVEASGETFIPIGASYELQVSIPGISNVEELMKDGFESLP